MKRIILGIIMIVSFLCAPLNSFALEIDSGRFWGSGGHKVVMFFDPGCEHCSVEPLVQAAFSGRTQVVILHASLSSESRQIGYIYEVLRGEIPDLAIPYLKYVQAAGAKKDATLEFLARNNLANTVKSALPKYKQYLLHDNELFRSSGVDRIPTYIFDGRFKIVDSLDYSKITSVLSALDDISESKLSDVDSIKMIVKASGSGSDAVTVIETE